MGFEQEKEANTELNLSLFSLPIKPQEPPGALTPPLRTTASIPFQWEEAPGKPRHCNTESKPQTSRTLELPPRLLTESKVAYNTNTNKNNNLCSPTTVLDGPEIGRSLFVSYSFRSPDNLGTRISSENRAGFFRGSSRWGSFRKKKEVVEAATTFDLFSSYLGTIVCASFRLESIMLSNKSCFTIFIGNAFKNTICDFKGNS